MNMGQIRALALSWLDDLNGDYFTTAQVNVWINNAQRECQKQLIQAGENFYTKRVSSTTVTNVESYTLPTDFMRLHKLEVVLSGTGVNEDRQLLTPMTLVQIDKVSMTTGTPEAYCIKKSCFILRPIPDSIKTLYLHYSPVVTDLAADNDVPDVPVQYHEYIAILTTINGFLKDDRDASQFLMRKAEYEKLMTEDTENRHVDAPRMILTTDDYDGGYLI